jgi:hypothetical protein
MGISYAVARRLYLESMERNFLISQLQNACDYEDKFISSFDSFLTTHVSDNYHLIDAEKDFVDTRIKILFTDSKRHLGIFKSMIEKINSDKYMVL